MRSWTLVVGAVLLASGLAWLALHRFTPDALLVWAVAAKRQAAANPAPTVAIFAAASFAAAACAIPIGALLTATGGFLFGGIEAGLVAVACATLGATVLFCVMRKVLAGADAHPRPARRLHNAAEAFRADAASYLLFLRATPIPFALVTISAAAAGIGLRTFAWTTALGIVPATLAHAFAGAAIGATTAAQRRAYETCLAAHAPSCPLPSPLSVLADPATALALAGIGVLALVPLALRKLLWRGTVRGTAAPSA